MVVLFFETSYFSVFLESTQLAVLSIPRSALPKCAWWIMREYGTEFSNDGNFRSLLMDDDGLSVICSASALPILQFLLKPEEYTVSPMNWRAFIINLSDSASEIPGTVYCLANYLSQEGLSILHISTFQAEVILVQEPMLAQAYSIFQQFEDPEKMRLLVEQAIQANTKTSSRLSLSILSDSNQPTTTHSTLLVPGSPPLHSQNILSEDVDNSFNQENDFDESWILPQKMISDPSISFSHVITTTSSSSAAINIVSQPVFKEEGFILCVLPNPVLLAKFKDPADLKRCAHILVS
jgi:hypothetical protein